MQCYLPLEEERITEKQEWSQANETRKGAFVISVICDGSYVQFQRGEAPHCGSQLFLELRGLQLEREKWGE